MHVCNFRNDQFDVAKRLHHFASWGDPCYGGIQVFIGDWVPGLLGGFAIELN